jgi:hypothetical protein
MTGFTHVLVVVIWTLPERLRKRIKFHHCKISEDSPMELPPRRVAGRQVHSVGHMATDIADQAVLRTTAMNNFV